MGLFYKKKRSHYERERDRLERMQENLNPLSPEYERVTTMLDRVQEQRNKERLLNRHVHMDLKKIGLGAVSIAGLIGINKVIDEHGEMLTGRARKTADVLMDGGIRWLMSGFGRF